MEESTHLTEISDGVSGTTIRTSDTNSTLREIATDLQEAHTELDEYHNGALVLSQNLKELRYKAERNGNTKLANTAHELEESALTIITQTKE
ncbi:hypothetical protein PNP85_14375 [Halobacterium salinarum]|uniref:hypothetical protein n=1 Tax=Halobacterium salinarum TaxID=2242 RepID=UPI00255792C6|nr:hypothetical protein [Halobacterium salinarum]MDL0135419.1 hypothetical protein [Halobacterium salinarum]MDL0140686.1 hypothetical protein [Halobacterium salinarum]